MLYTDDVDAVFKKAVALGAKANQPPTDMFWGDRMGNLTDPFGHSWAVATHKEDVTPEEIMRGWGFQVEDLPGDAENLPVEVEEDLDITKDSREAESSPAEDDEAWPYTYFVWKLHRREDVPAQNAAIMRKWQEAIVEECQRREVAVNFGVGLMGGKQDQRFTTMSVRGVTVAFLSVIHADKIEEIAPRAVQRLTTVRA
jgi:hypothetical protein